MVSLNSNSLSLNYLNRAQAQTNTAMNRLSSGHRINSAKDDAAGLAISDRMTSTISGLSMAIRNANDGISLAQTADGALSESTSILQRMRELSVQSSNGIYNASDRAAMNKEFSQLNSELARVSEQTTFNGEQILNGEFSGASFQVGADGGETVGVTIDNMSPENLGVSELNISTVEGAQGAIEAIDQALTTISETRGDLGVTQNRFESAISNLSVTSENLVASRSRIEDADFAAEVSDLARSRILEQSGVAMQAQANSSAETVLRLLI